MKHTMTAGLLLTSALAGCGAAGEADRSGTPAETPASPAASASVEASAPAPDTGEAETAAARAFVDGLFAAYANDTPLDPLGEPQPVFEPELAAALTALGKEAAANGEIPDALGADPLCDCQDYGEFSHRITALTVTGTRAEAEVAISNFGAKSVRRLIMLRTPAGWRVFDIDGRFRALVQP